VGDPKATAVIVSSLSYIWVLLAACGSNSPPAGNAPAAADQATKSYLAMVNTDFPLAYPPETPLLSVCPAVDSANCRPELVKVRAAGSKFLDDLAGGRVPPRLAGDDDLLRQGLHALLDALDAIAASIDAKDAARFEAAAVMLRQAERTMGTAKANMSVHASGQTSV
jgi:hypothetical protein